MILKDFLPRILNPEFIRYNFDLLLFRGHPAAMPETDQGNISIPDFPLLLHQDSSTPDSIPAVKVGKTQNPSRITSSLQEKEQKRVILKTRSKPLADETINEDHD